MFNPDQARPTQTNARYGATLNHEHGRRPKAPTTGPRRNPVATTPMKHRVPRTHRAGASPTDANVNQEFNERSVAPKPFIRRPKQPHTNLTTVQMQLKDAINAKDDVARLKAVLREPIIVQRQASEDVRTGRTPKTVGRNPPPKHHDINNTPRAGLSLIRPGPP